MDRRQRSGEEKKKKKKTGNSGEICVCYEVALCLLIVFEPLQFEILSSGGSCSFGAFSLYDLMVT